MRMIGNVRDAGGPMEPGAWTDGPWLALDTETTGVLPGRDRLVTAATVYWSRGRNTGTAGSARVRTWLAQPSMPIPAAATSVHGVTTEHARRHGTPVREVLEEVNAAVADHLRQGRPLVVFNAGFDLPLLAAESARHGVAPLAERLPDGVVPVVDPLVLDRALVTFRRGKRRLADLLPAYGVRVPANTHQAEVDAQLTLSLLAALLAEHPTLRDMAVSEVHEFQKVQHAQWAESLERYLRSRGRTTAISRTWF